VGLDTRQARRNLVLLEPAVAQRGRGQRKQRSKQSSRSITK
jgi:hypothetical protein